MTGREVYNRAVSFLMEPPEQDRDFLDAALSLINAGIAELESVQRSRCIHRGEEYLRRVLDSLDDEIMLDEPLCDLLAVYLASHFLRDDLNDAASERFFSRFTSAKEQLKQVHFCDVTDLYGGNTDEN